MDSVHVTGRLIGGCVETLCNLAGTPYGDVTAFGRQHADDGLIVYLEASEDEAATICRNVHGSSRSSGENQRRWPHTAANARRGS